MPADESTGWIAKGWNLDKPEIVKLKLVSKGTNCTLKLGEKYVVRLTHNNNYIQDFNSLLSIQT